MGDAGVQNLVRALQEDGVCEKLISLHLAGTRLTAYGQTSLTIGVGCDLTDRSVGLLEEAFRGGAGRDLVELDLRCKSHCHGCS